MIALIPAVVLAVAAAFHVYWAIGGQVGLGVSVPQRCDGQPLFRPSAALTLAVGLALAGALVLVLAIGGYLRLGLPSVLIRGAVALVCVVFLARALSWSTYVGLFKKIRDTPFARYDTWLYSPLCLAVGTCLICLLAQR